MQILITNRAILTPLQKSDFEEIIDMYFEPDSNQYIPPLLNKDRASYLEFLTKKITHNSQPKGLGFWVVRDTNDHSFLGTANLNVMEVLQITHVGCHLSRRIWGQGYGSELVQCLVQYGLQDLKLPVIYGIVSPAHHASKKMLRKAGLDYDKTIDLHGQAVDLFKINLS